MDALNVGRLIRASFAKINGEVGPGSVKTGGSLNVEIKAGMKPIPDEETKAGARVEIKVTGIPKGEKDLDQFAFRLEVRVNGVFEWERANDLPQLNSASVTQLMCQSLYTMAVLEVQTLGDRMGFGNIELPWQLNNAPSSSSEKKKPSKRTKSITSDKTKKTTTAD